MSTTRDTIVLIRPDESHKDAILEYRDEFMVAGETIHGSGSLESMGSFEDWLQKCRDSENKATIPKDRVPASQYLAIRKSDGKLVGMIQIRHELNDFLRLHGGHIGYSVRKSERRKGYATQMLEAALAQCKKLGIRKALLTCDPDNVASAGVIKANGGVYEKRVNLDDGSRLDHYWVELS